MDTLPLEDIVLAGQKAHIEPPEAFSAHAKHAAPSAPVNPRSHTQSSIAALPTEDTALAGHCAHNVPPVTFRYVPAAQSEHAPDPFTPLCLPTAHAEHADPSGPSYPKLQMQSTISSLLAGDIVFAGHDKQADP
eukprot:678341-Rhodomonas_salina.2